MRLEPEFWHALEDIGYREDLTRSQLLTFIANRQPGSPLTSAVRVFIASYYCELSGFVRQPAAHLEGTRSAPENITALNEHGFGRKCRPLQSASPNVRRMASAARSHKIKGRGIGRRAER